MKERSERERGWMGERVEKEERRDTSPSPTIAKAFGEKGSIDCINRINQQTQTKDKQYLDNIKLRRV
jgi:hypothetical protein